MCLLGGREVPPRPWTIHPPQMLTSVLTNPVLGRLGEGAGRESLMATSERCKIYCKKKTKKKSE